MCCNVIVERDCDSSNPHKNCAFKSGLTTHAVTILWLRMKEHSLVSGLESSESAHYKELVKKLVLRLSGHVLQLLKD